MQSEQLKKKFEDLQLQQQQALLRRKQKENTSSSQSFGVTDDLNLDTNYVTSSSSFGINVALEDANNSMRMEIRELRDETGRLRKSIGEKEYEIKRLSRKIEKTEEEKKIITNAGVASSSAATKIVELSKRNRELTAELEAEKARFLKEQKRFMDSRNEKSTILSPRKDRSPRPSDVDNIDQIREKYNACNIKLSEYRNHIQELKQELKVANKVLQQEIGETFSSMPALLSSGGGGFRGRAQQIISLQDKVKDLEQKLKSDSGFKMESRPDKNLLRIKAMERQRKEQNEELQEDLVRLNEQNAELQQKFDATKARNMILRNEIKSLKSQLSVLSEKGSHDNELIMKLMKQHDDLQKMLQQNLNAKTDLEKSGAKVNAEVHNVQQREQAEISSLRKLLAERDERLRQLEENVELLSGSNSGNGDGRYTDKPLAASSSAYRRSVTEDEYSNTESQASGLKSNLAKELEDTKLQCVRYETFYKALRIEKDKQSDMVNVLNTRIEELTLACQKLNSDLHDERRKNAGFQNNAKQMRQGSSTGTALPSESKISELETTLMIQADENSNLKETLESTLQAKQEDANLFHEMLEQTKTVFLEALQSLSSRSS